MTARAFLVRGLLAGLLAGCATFLVAYAIGEPSVEAAIAQESSTHQHPAGGHDETATGHDHTATGNDEEPVVSRGVQRTWGLLTGSLAAGTALGGLVALVAAAAVGRVGRLRASATCALVALVGFVSVALVPFLKYPANPPAVGNAETIGSRTAEYFVFLLVSVAVAAAATALAARSWPRLGSYRSVLLGTGAYVVLVTTVGTLMPTVNEVGDFPADTLWYFRRAALLTLVALWVAIGVILTGLVGRLEQRESAAARRRELAAAL